LAERATRLGLVGKREEALSHRKRFVDLLLRNTVIDKLEEAYFDRCGPELFGDLGFARLEGAHADTRDVAGFGRANTAKGLFLFELVESKGCVAMYRHGFGRLCSRRLKQGPAPIGKHIS
jgi:hypothetical protein